eukprot:GHUV01050429.1.p1 GENE.GHUV01050429.1~~GHUV01050429.1.p1  ORF type:complete len:223 (+),score=42.63 GHUV01050429.1:540-1208(+)
MFGATVLDDKAFFHGGILSNEATIPVNSSGFEVLDLKTMAPMIVQIDDKNNSVLSSRYRHQLAAWKNTILAVGGQIDDDFGVSRHIINVLVLNLNQRLWEVKKQFIQRSGASGQGDVMIDASVVSGDQLLVTFLQLDPTNFGRSFFSMNLNNQEVDYNFNVVRCLAGVQSTALMLCLSMSLGQIVLVISRQRQILSACLVLGGASPGLLAGTMWLLYVARLL